MGRYGPTKDQKRLFQQHVLRLLDEELSVHGFRLHGKEYLFRVSGDGVIQVIHMFRHDFDLSFDVSIGFGLLYIPHVLCDSGHNPIV